MARTLADSQQIDQRLLNYLLRYRHHTTDSWKINKAPLSLDKQTTGTTSHLDMNENRGQDTQNPMADSPGTPGHVECLQYSQTVFSLGTMKRGVGAL
jgi:hypothetical protein